MEVLTLYYTCLLLVVLVTLGVNGQTDGDVRLVDGTTAAGRVEVYYQSTWGTICDDGWDPVDSDVVCKQLGFLTAIATTSSTQGPTAQQIWLKDVQCEQADERLVDCVTDQAQWGDTLACSHAQDVGVQCAGLYGRVAPNYKGCFRFSDNPVTGGSSAAQFPGLTIEDCLQGCSDDSMMFAANYGDHCLCGDTLDSAVLPVDDLMCKIPCSGDALQICGDETNNLMSVNEVGIGKGYLSSPWFPGSFITATTDTTEPTSYISMATIDTSAGVLTIRFLALDLGGASGGSSTLVVEANSMCVYNLTSASGTPADQMLTGLPAITTLTATLSTGSSDHGVGFLISYGPNAITTTTQPATSAAPEAPTTQPMVTDPQTTSSDSSTTDQDTTLAPATQPPTSASDTRVASVRCTHPVVENGTIIGRDTSPYRPGELVTLSCDEGLEPEGTTSLVCQNDGTWDPPPACSSPSSAFELWMIIMLATLVAVTIVSLCSVCCNSFPNRRRDTKKTGTHGGTLGRNRDPEQDGADAPEGDSNENVTPTTQSRDSPYDHPGPKRAKPTENSNVNDANREPMSPLSLKTNPVINEDAHYYVNTKRKTNNGLESPLYATLGEDLVRVIDVDDGGTSGSPPVTVDAADKSQLR